MKFKECHIAEIKAASMDYWFSKSSRRFFNTRLPTIGIKLEDGSYMFVSSELPLGKKQRRFTIRKQVNGRTRMVGDLFAYSDRKTATKAMKYIAEQIKEGETQ